MRTVGNEGRCFVLSAISCVTKKNLPAWINDPKQNNASAPPVANGDAASNGLSSPLASSPSRSQHGRRRSTFTVQEERHELVLPAMDEDMATTSSAVSDASPAPAMSSKIPAGGDDFVCRGGSCIAGPMGQAIVEPLWEVEDGGLLIHEADFEDCERGRLDLDVAGSYSRSDAFHLTVDGLDISPPP